MSAFRKNKGFTLAELAVAVVVIGVLVAGVLKARTLLQAADVTGTIAQVTMIDAATTSFKKTYSALPGDMLCADERITGCNQACRACLGVGVAQPCAVAYPICAAVAPGSAGDGIVGATNWDLRTRQSGATHLSNNPPLDVGAETVLFWAQLSLIGLLPGITKDGLSEAPGTLLVFGGALPAARVGGGFAVGYSGGSVAPTAIPPAPNGRLAAAGNYSMVGTVLALMNRPPVTPGNITAGQQLLTPGQAAQFDRKMDDGFPSSGIVQAYGVTASCYSTVAPFPATGGYRESVRSRDCGLYFLIQN